MSDMRCNDYIDNFLTNNPDSQKCVEVGKILIGKLDSLDEFLKQTGSVLRRSVDEVIDMPRTQRYSLDQIEKTEKTYIGTKVEILFRHQFKLVKGDKLDLRVAGEEVDIKNTIGTSWMIPQEAVNELCLLIKIDDKKGRFNVGIVYCDLRNLTTGKNRDQKRSISSGNRAIFWIGKNVPMQKNFFESMSPDICLQLTDVKASGAERVRRLCRLLPNVVFNRYIIECVAQQKDPMKRVRGNGGARDKLRSEDIHILSGTYDQEKLHEYGFDNLEADDWIAVHPKLLT